MKKTSIQSHPCIPSPLYPPSLNIKAFTWLRDSHGLYDYESLHVIRNTIKLENEGILGRSLNDVKSFTELDIKQAENLLSQERPLKLASVQCHDGTLLGFTK